MATAGGVRQSQPGGTPPPRESSHSGVLGGVPSVPAAHGRPCSHTASECCMLQHDIACGTELAGPALSASPKRVWQKLIRPVLAITQACRPLAAELAHHPGCELRVPWQPDPGQEVAQVRHQQACALSRCRQTACLACARHLLSQHSVPSIAQGTWPDSQAHPASCPTES